MSNENILSRIRKLLAMAKDSGSPNEAAIAARRARHLMDAHQVSELDLATVDDNMLGEEAWETGYKTANTAVGTIAVSVAMLNDCTVTYLGRDRTRIHFRGFLADTVCCCILLTYLKDEMYSCAEANAQGKRDRHAYRLGYASGVSHQVRQLRKDRENLVSESTGTSLVITKKAIVESHFGKAKYSSKSRKYSGSDVCYTQGHEAGKRASLNRQVSEKGRKALAN